MEPPAHGPHRAGMTARERRTFLLAAAILLAASVARYGYDRSRARPILPADSAGVRDELLQETREARAEEERRSRPLAEGEKIDPNRADAAELDRLPGVGPAVADRIVEARSEGGFARPDDLERVRGIGPATAERMAPHLDFSRAPPLTLPSTGPPVGGALGERRSGGTPLTAPVPAGGAGDAIDLNRAGRRELEELRGIGPALADRILALRGEKGGFERVDELLDVRGIGPRTLERLRPRIRVGP